VKFHLDYDLGDGTKRAVVGVQAQVGWELRTKKKIGSIAEGYAVSDMAGCCSSSCGSRIGSPRGSSTRPGS
jgi:hypothetical protein